MSTIKYIFILILLTVCYSISGQEQIKIYDISMDKKLQKKLYGNWIVIKYTEADQAPGASKNAFKYVHETIYLDPHLAVLFKDSCKYPDYKVSRQNTWRYLYDNYREPHAIGIKDDSISVVELSCKVEPKYASKDYPLFDSAIMITSKDDIIIYEPGLFLYMKKVK